MLQHTLKNLLSKFNETHDVEKSLVILNLLQLNFLNIIKMYFENTKLEDNYNICRLIITENKLNNFNEIKDYFQDDIKSYSSSIFNNIYLRLNGNNNYIYNLPIFIFNLDSQFNCLSLRIFKTNGEDFYYLLTPRFIHEKDNKINFHEYLNNILIKDISYYSEIIKKFKNEILMVENVINITNC